ncbi:MAG: hypothetical protein U0230_14520 [Polyangiales bacterium]
MERVHRIFLMPGFFGFGRLAGYDYFGHVSRGLASRLDERGIRFSIEVVPCPPTASIRRRARFVAETILAAKHGPDDPIHLVGHSTGGLDARMVASPTTDLGPLEGLAEARARIASVVSISTPHHGTPLAQFFATVSGTRLLYALSLLTVTTLSVGGPPLTAATALLSSLKGLDDALGLDVGLFDESIALILRFLGDRGRGEVRDWLERVRTDQGALLQLTPEAMDVFNAGVVDAGAVRYGSIVNSSPPPGAIRLATRMRKPFDALSSAIYATIYAVTAAAHETYPYPAPGEGALSVLEGYLGRDVTERFNDGVVPTLSMVHGTVIWAGPADHLDVVGHFHGGPMGPGHTDWLASGARFTRPQFDEMLDRLARFLVADGTKG